MTIAGYDFFFFFNNFQNVGATVIHLFIWNSLYPVLRFFFLNSSFFLTAIGNIINVRVRWTHNYDIRVQIKFHVCSLYTNITNHTVPLNGFNIRSAKEL